MFQIQTKPSVSKLSRQVLLCRFKNGGGRCKMKKMKKLIFSPVKAVYQTAEAPTVHYPCQKISGIKALGSLQNMQLSGLISQDIQERVYRNLRKVIFITVLSKGC